jgi:hypothetical protein
MKGIPHAEVEEQIYTYYSPVTSNIDMRTHWKPLGIITNILVREKVV